MDVPQAATILSAYQEARALLIGKSVASPMEGPVRSRVFGLMNYTGCESRLETTMESGLFRP